MAHKPFPYTTLQRGDADEQRLQLAGVEICSSRLAAKDASPKPKYVKMFMWTEKPFYIRFWVEETRLPICWQSVPEAEGVRKGSDRI